MENIIHHLERLRERRRLIDQRKNLVVRNHDEGIHFSAERFERFLRLLLATQTLKAEGLRDDGNREDSHGARHLRDWCNASAPRSTAESRREEDHVRPLQHKLNFVRTLLRRLLSNIRVCARAESPCRAAADIELLSCRIVVESLRVRIHRYKFHSLRLHFDHSLHSIAAAAADADHADRSARDDIRKHLLMGE